LSEIVEVKVTFPKKLYDVTRLVCARFDYDVDTFISEALAGDIEASAANNFEGYLDDFIKGVKDQLESLDGCHSLPQLDTRVS
jgi:hypothetical protein